jgi:predicted PurR-regulated permease PerM
VLVPRIISTREAVAIAASGIAADMAQNALQPTTEATQVHAGNRVAHHLREWRSLTLFLLTLSGVVLCLLFANHLIFPITGAITLAIVTAEPMRWLKRHMSPALAATVMLVAIVVAMVLPGFYIVRHLIHELFGVVHFVQRGELRESLQDLASRHPKLGQYIRQGTDQFLPDDAGQIVAQRGAMYLGAALQWLVQGVVKAGLMLFLLWFLLRDQDLALKSLIEILPLPAPESTNFVYRLGELTDAIFLGRFLIAGLQGLLAGLAYWVLGVHGSLLWGVLTGLFCLVPAFGALLVWVPIALYLGLQDSWTKALLLTLWCGAVVSTMDNFLYPVLVGRRTDLHTAVIFASILGGLALFGISGFVLGPVIVAATMLLLRMWRAEPES